MNSHIEFFFKWFDHLWISAVLLDYCLDWNDRYRRYIESKGLLKDSSVLFITDVLIDFSEVFPLILSFSPSSALGIFCILEAMHYQVLQLCPSHF